MLPTSTIALYSRHCLLAIIVWLLFAAPALAGEVNASSLQEGHTYDRFIVQFYQNSRERNNVSARQQALDAVGKGNGIGVSQLLRLALGADVIKTSRRLDRASAERFMQQLARNPHVDYVEPDSLVHADFTPNDSYYSQQWGYFQATAGINLPPAWNISTGSGTVVAVIDTGIASHSDLSANVLAGYDFISDIAKAGDGNGRDANPKDEGDWVTLDQCTGGHVSTGCDVEEGLVDVRLHQR